MSDDVTLDVTDGVATVTLDNPEQMNALSPGIVAGVERALGEIAEHDDARCVVVEGAGDAFCAGGDISGMGGGDVSGHERAEAVTESATRVAYGLYDCDLPTVAKVDGYCVGAGMGVALSCDVVLASEDATFGLAFRNVGLSLDYGTSYLVTQAVGPYKAKELALTAEMLSGEEAEELGLVNHAYAPGEFDDKADAFVETVAEGPTVALEYSLNNIDRAARRTVEEAIEAESQAQSFATQTRDHEEGVAAFAEDREPEFEGR
jgi:enoyl-CoA hydratase/carnithine racemase